MKVSLRAFLGLAFALLASGVVSAAPGVDPEAVSPERAGTCSELRLFKEWRDMTKEHQLGYINAVLCLTKLPPKDKSRPDPKTRYEEFQATHIYLTERVHSVGHFLPWHRHLGTLYANALRDECGYQGPMAFWDWSRDADIASIPLKNSPIFDPVYGFGGDGVPGTYTLPPDPVGDSAFFPWTFIGCVMTGPFANTRSHLGPGKLLTEHCIVRGINETWRRSVLSANVQTALKSQTYEDFRLIIDNFLNPIHGGGHGIVGGEMLNIYSAGADPLFYLHHANLDRVWWRWQHADLPKRQYALSGPTTQGGKTQVTLDFVLDFPALGPNVTVRDTMDTRSAPECFTYDY